MFVEAAILGFDIVLSYLPPFIAALVIIVFIHEFGHFIVGRWCGVKVETFAIGFGREVFGWNDKHGTRWKLCLLPLGGYVKFEGDANAASFPSQDESATTSKTSFHGKAVWQRALIVLAGPVANFLLAIAIFTASYSLIGVAANDPRIDKVIAGGAAEQAGLKAGDFVRKINGSVTNTFSEVRQYVQVRPDEELLLTIERDGKLMEIVARTKVSVESDNFGGTIRMGRLGFEHDATRDAEKSKKLSLPDAFSKGVYDTWFVVSTTMRYLKKIVVGEESSKMIGGPTSIAKGAGDAAKNGLLGFMGFVAVISVSIGLINLFPVPMLDGGHLVFYALEAIRGKPLGARAQEWGMRVGLSLVLMLMVFGTLNDILRIGAMF